MAHSILTKRGFLYLLTFPNGKAYVGITSRTVKERFDEHVNNNRYGKRACAVHAAIEKYGAPSVKVDVLAEASWEHLVDLEIKAIAALNTRPPFGYNLTIGGEGVRGMDAVTRAKISASSIGKKMSAAACEKMRANRTGKTHSAETKRKMSDAKKLSPKNADHIANLAAINAGRVVTEETRFKISEAIKGIVRSETTRIKIGEASKGRCASAETKAKLRAIHLGRPKSDESIAKRTASRARNRLLKAAGIQYA